METEQGNAGGTSTITNEDKHIFAEGTIVQVQARTWPGINKPGGIGRITQLHISDDKVTDVDVHYIVVGGRERRVPIQYVKLAPEYVSSPSDVAASFSGAAPGGRSQRNQLRDRSIMLGRCKRCGSLRADCGSCDWMEQERLAEHARNQPADTGVNVDDDLETERIARKKRRIAEAVIEESLSSSSEEELFEQMQTVDRRRPRYSREKVQWRRLLRDSSSESSRKGELSHEESSLSSSDPDDPILAKLAEVTRQRRRSKANFLELKYAKAKEKRRRRRPLHTSVSTLESLSESRIASKLVKPRTALTPDSFQFPSPAVPPKSQREIEQSEQVENVGDPSLSPGGGPPSPNSDQSEEMGTSEHRGSKFESQEVNAPDVSLDLEGVGFIQPEGAVAAGHLPQDIIDRTLSVSFKQLPSFFDELVMELKDCIIPDANLALSDFQHRSRGPQNCNDSFLLRQSKEER